MVGLYFLIGLLLVGAVIYWQDELGVPPKPSRSYASQIDAPALVWACVGTFFAWPITTVILGASYLRNRKKQK